MTRCTYKHFSRDADLVCGSLCAQQMRQTRLLIYQKTNKNEKFLTVSSDQRRREVPMATRDQLSLQTRFVDDFSAFCTTTTIRLTSWVCCDTGVQAPKENRSSLGLPKRVLTSRHSHSRESRGRNFKDQNNIIMGGREKRPFNFCGGSFPVGILYI